MNRIEENSRIAANLRDAVAKNPASLIIADDVFAEDGEVMEVDHVKLQSMAECGDYSTNDIARVVCQAMAVSMFLDAQVDRDKHQLSAL